MYHVYLSQLGHLPLGQGELVCLILLLIIRFPGSNSQQGLAAIAVEGSEGIGRTTSSQLENLSEPGLAHRHVYLGFNCFENARAHWFLYIPYPSHLDAHNNIGKVIQVTGNPFVGFGFQIKLNHNALQQPETHYLLLGTVPSSTIVDDYQPNLLAGPEFRDQPLAGDKLEQIAYDLGLPYHDPSAVLPPAGDPLWLKPHPQFERCQEWTRKLISCYVNEGILPPSALEVPDKATSVGLRYSQAEDQLGQV